MCVTKPLGSTPSVDQGREYHQNHHAMEPFMHSLICDMIRHFVVGSTWLAGMRSLQKTCFSPTSSWHTCTTAFKEISPNCKGNLVWNCCSQPSTWHNDRSAQLLKGLRPLWVWWAWWGKEVGSVQKQMEPVHAMWVSRPCVPCWWWARNRVDNMDWIQWENPMYRHIGWVYRTV